VIPGLQQTESFSPFEYVFPILTVDQNCVAQTYEGTGFCVARGLLVTSWHCVRAELPSGINYAVAYMPNAERGPIRQLDLPKSPKTKTGRI